MKTKKLNLTNLKRGDVLVLRDGTRRVFNRYVAHNLALLALPFIDFPACWHRRGYYDALLGPGSKWDIARVIRRKLSAADRDAMWLLTAIADGSNWAHLKDMTAEQFDGFCKISRCLNGGKARK